MIEIISLEERINQYINEELLNFNNIKPYYLDETDFRNQVLKRLFLQKYSKKSQSEEAKSYTAQKVDDILTNNLPFIFCFCFGGYKHFWSPTYPEPDWAEIFTIKYLMEYILPIARAYFYGTTLEFESEEVAISAMNNVPQDGLDKYNIIFKELLEYISSNCKEPLNLNLVLARDFYDKNELFSKIKDYKNVVEERFKKLDKEEQQKRLKRTETNIKWDGEKDLTKLNEKDKESVIYNSRILNEAFLDIDYELRGKEYFDKKNLIPLVGTWGLGREGEAWLHIASNRSSIVDFWAGIGIFEIRGEKIVERTLSKKQFEQVKDHLIKVNIKTEISKFSNNYSWIYVYEGELNF